MTTPALLSMLYFLLPGLMEIGGGSLRVARTRSEAKGLGDFADPPRPGVKEMLAQVAAARVRTGTPQGGNISPVLANVYLHYALDLWIEKVVKPCCYGEVLLCRYADDWVCAFRYQEDAERFYRVLAKRLKKFNLALAAEKTRLLRFSRFHPSRTRGFTFLGFEFYWKVDRGGEPRVMRQTARKRLQGACRRIKEWIKLNRHLPGGVFFKRLNARLRGHYNYYGVRGNSHSLYRFYQWAMGCAFKRLNRRGWRRSYTWAQFQRVLAFVAIDVPRITELRHRRVFS